jgi:hypothetical protein
MILGRKKQEYALKNFENPIDIYHVRCYSIIVVGRYSPQDNTKGGD